MTNKSRSFLRVSVVPALLLGGVCAIAQAAPTNWSDPATWPNRKVPIAGDKVTIGRDKDVILDVSPPALGGLSIDGKLTFSNDADLELTTEWIMLHGELRSAAKPRPHTRNATITLTNTVPNEDVMAGMGDRGIMISGGTLNLHGDRDQHLDQARATRQKPAARRSKCWTPRAGASATRSCSRRPTSIRARPSGARSPPSTATRSRSTSQLEYMHFGKITFDVDERGEVGLLTRNIKIQASADAEQTLLRRAHHGDAVEQDVRLGRRAEPHGPAHDAGPLSDPLAPGGRAARASTSRTPPSTTPTTAA